VKENALKYHLALGRLIDLEGIDRDAQAGKCPRHVMWGLSQRLGAAIHIPKGNPVLPLDKIRAKLAGRSEHWAIARSLSSQLTSEDLIFCTGEDVGIPIATLCGAKRERPKIVVFIHNIDRPRGRVALKLLGLADRIDLFVTNARPQADFLGRYLRLPEDRIWVLPEQTDTSFFTPGSASPDKARRIIASVGLEKRDYQTLAEATSDLDLDVKIAGFSKDAIALARAFPKVMPDNMSNRFYEWAELVQLYRDADLAVVSVLDNKYTAGITTLLEAMACRRPVVVTRTQGLSEYLAPPGIATVVNPGDSAGMRQAILTLLNNPQEAEAQAQRGYELILKQHNSEQYIEALAERLAVLSVATS
jgi:glycosyltransferase involved in cell wall biosynthesis